MSLYFDNWKEYIANSFIPYERNNGETVRLSNGKIEGKNSYIKKMLKLANGYSNFERFRNRAMYCENYYETYSEEKLPNTVKRKFPKKKDQLE
ncbi:MAG: transposase [Firmicutes bacterium]|nr:transposase [Candidatus Colivicinus equi]